LVSAKDKVTQCLLVNRAIEQEDNFIGIRTQCFVLSFLLTDEQANAAERITSSAQVTVISVTPCVQTVCSPPDCLYTGCHRNDR